MNNLVVFLLAAITLLQGCKLVDLQTKQVKDEGFETHNIEKGKALLENAWNAQGMDNLANYATYSVIAEDHWRGLLGKMGKVWPESRSDIELKYVVGTFDSQVTFLNGKEEGLTAGLQSWNYYEGRNGEALAFKEKADKRIRFGLSAFQYFFELADRLKRAPIVTYAGEKEHKGEVYDLVFATWETTKPHEGHDQYRLWLDKETGLIEYAEFTVRDQYMKMPGYKALYGSIYFSDFRDINGVNIPFEQSIYLNAPGKKESKYLHRLTVSEFTFDDFGATDLLVDPEILQVGDAKIE